VIRPALADVVPYEPGKPIEEVQRELGLERVIKLASNEGQFGPFPEALEAMERAAPELYRYPDGGAYRLRATLAERLGVLYEEIAIGSGSDGLVDALSQATLDPGDEVVCGWPSFPSYVIYAAKLGAVSRRVPLVDDRYDLDALLDAVGPRTKLVYVCHPNNPTGTMNTRAELDAYFERVPGHVLTIVDQAYLEYIDDADYPDAIEEYFKRGRKLLVLRTFSKIYGLAGLRVGYAIGDAELVTALGKTRRAFDVTTPAQVAAVASLDNPDEVARRRSLNEERRAVLAGALERLGFRVPSRGVGNFVYAHAGEDARGLFEALLALGVIVRPLAGFGSPEAIRVTVGAPDENELCVEALARVRAEVAPGTG
jgi:histidinol-phosphate aminotransferase